MTSERLARPGQTIGGGTMRFNPKPAFAAIALAVFVAACGQSSASPAASTGSPGGSKLLVVVTDSPIGVNEFLKNAVLGANNAASAHGMTVRVFEVSDPSQLDNNVQAAVALKPAVVIAVGFGLGDALAKEAPANPGQQFLFVDACTPTAIPNVACVSFREQEGVFLAGAEAGLLANGEATRFGDVLVLDTPRFRRYSTPFGAGAQLINPGSSLTTLIVGGSNPFSDPARAKEQALTLASRGITSIMAAAAAGNFGVFEAAKAKNLKVWGVDINQCPSQPGFVVDNVVKRLDLVIPQGVDKILSGQYGGSQSYGLAENGISLTGLDSGVATSQCLIAAHPDIITKIQSIRSDIISGKTHVVDPLTGS